LLVFIVLQFGLLLKSMADNTTMPAIKRPMQRAHGYCAAGALAFFASGTMMS
jgi:hypothetical protein